MLRVSRGFVSHVKGTAWLFLIVRAYVAVPGGYFSMKPVRKFQCNGTDPFREDTPVLKAFLRGPELKRGKEHISGVGNNNICCCQV